MHRPSGVLLATACAFGCFLPSCGDQRSEPRAASGASGFMPGSTSGGAGATGVPATGGAGATSAGTGGGAGMLSGAPGGAGAGGALAAGGAGGAAAANGAGTTGATSGAATTGDSFVLAWQDDFDTVDLEHWELETFSFDGNLAQFSTANASAKNGILSIALTPEATDTAKPYRGVELRSKNTLTYGKVEARLRFAKGSGVVSSLVLIYTPWPADDWNELDIEHLGKASNTVQLNCQVYTGPPTTPPVTTSVAPTQDPLQSALPFDAEADFHLYTIEWTPTGVRFSADGNELRTWDSQIARMKLPQNILFTIWASSAASWAGALTTDSAPTTADIDWIKVYSLGP